MPERPGQHQPNEPFVTDEQLDRMIESEIARRIESPDLTRAILGRLGYMRVPQATVRRRRRARWMRRIATAACLSLALFAGLMMHRQSADSRRPVGPTIPAALHNSFEYGGEQIDRAIDSIRRFDIFPAREQPAPERDFIRWHRPELERGNQPPFRWVSRGLAYGGLV